MYEYIVSSLIVLLVTILAQTAKLVQVAFVLYTCISYPPPAYIKKYIMNTNPIRMSTLEVKQNSTWSIIHYLESSSFASPVPSNPHHQFLYTIPFQTKPTHKATFRPHTFLITLSGTPSLSLHHTQNTQIVGIISNRPITVCCLE